jgi:hypothetical protein
MMNNSKADPAIVPVAYEAETAIRALLTRRVSKSTEEAQQRFEDAGINEIVTAFRVGLEEKYGAHLPSAEKEIIWEAARAFAPNRTWAETEEAYRKMAVQI